MKVYENSNIKDVEDLRLLTIFESLDEFARTVHLSKSAHVRPLIREAQNILERRLSDTNRDYYNV